MELLTDRVVFPVEHQTRRTVTDLDSLEDGHSLEHLTVRVRRQLAPVAVALESGRLGQGKRIRYQRFSIVFCCATLRIMKMFAPAPSTYATINSIYLHNCKTVKSTPLHFLFKIKEEKKHVEIIVLTKGINLPEIKRSKQIKPLFNLQILFVHI